MKAKEFLDKLLLHVSDIEFVAIQDGNQKPVDLNRAEILMPKAPDNPHSELLNGTVDTFQIKGPRLTIYTKTRK